MKRIYVTVDEFINNGAEFNSGRALYIATPEGNIVLAGYFFRKDQIADPYCIVVSTGDHNFKLNIKDVFVQIFATPIYK